MQRITDFFVRPFSERGMLLGTLDLFVKLLTIVFWVLLLGTLVSLVATSFAVDYNPMKRLWWVFYSFIVFAGGSLLAYILVFVRSYNQD